MSYTITMLRRFVLFCFVFFLFSPIFSLSVRKMSPAESFEARTKMVEYSKQFIGTPYLYGGTDRKGIDCSGFIYTVSRESIGVQLPRTTAALYAEVTVIEDSEREIGDLVFFKTVGGKISHVGLYLGNNQFIHSASDGPNTGVIISSLKESYWSKTYYSSGRFLPPTSASGKSFDKGKTAEENEEQFNQALVDSGKKSSNRFLDKVELETTLAVDWNFFTANKFLLNFRGASADLEIRYTGWDICPGFGTVFSYDPQMKIFRLPIIFSLFFDNGLKVYVGPVFSFGSAIEPGTEEEISPSVFPGIMGISWQTPSLKLGSFEFSLVQDLRYTVYNSLSGSALNFLQSLSCGTVFSTGLRVTFPLSILF